MCGRIALTHQFRKFDTLPGVSFYGVAPRYNIAPTSEIPVVRQSAPDLYRLDRMRWGLVPHWSREPSVKFSTFNARAETASSKAAFRDSFKHRRCLIPSSGFYEWKQVGSKKEPYYFTDAEEKGLAFAGLWDHWRGETEELYSCTILVCPSNELLAPIHDRMPVILEEGDYTRWLDPDTSTEDVQTLLRPLPAALMKGWPVGPAVGNTRNEAPSLIEPFRPLL